MRDRLGLGQRLQTQLVTPIRWVASAFGVLTLVCTVSSEPVAEPTEGPAERTIARLTFDESDGGVLRVSRAAGEWRRVDVQQKVGPLDRGILRLNWRMNLERYAPGPTQPNAETLYTVRLLNDKAQSFFHLAFQGVKQAEGGPIVAAGTKGELARWKPGTEMELSLVVNLEANTCTVLIDGKTARKEIALNRPGAMQTVQFRDGTGLGLQDGAITVVVDDVTMTHQIVSEAPLERLRKTPPLDNPVPTLSPKPADEKSWTVPGVVRTTWVGNTFGGESGKGGHQNGFGDWVQNGIAPGAFAVTPDGTIVAGVPWDEAGRSVGLYKDGRINHRLVAQYDMRGGHRSWAFGTSNRAVAADENYIYVGNSEGHLIRFSWKPGDLESHRWFDQLEMGKEYVARSLTARDGKVAALLTSGEVRVWQSAEEGFAPVANWRAPEGTKAICMASDGGFWIIAANNVQKLSLDGVADTDRVITDAGSPSAISLAPDGTLVVCDNGPRQQVRFYDVSGSAPRFLRTFGEEGGLRAGTPGEPAPQKLWGLAGAGVDAQGNLYVGCCLHVASRGTAVKAFDSTGAALWDVQCHGFTDGYSFDPASDGDQIVGADELISVDLDNPAPGAWSLKALTLDPKRYPDDPRLQTKHTNSGAVMRYVGGRRLLYTVGMQSGGFNLFAFEEAPSQIAHAVGRVGKGGWAWEVDAKGDIWRGDLPKSKTIERYRFVNWTDDKPVFATDKPDSWPAPAGLRQICRVHYDDKTDTLYVGGYPNGVKEPAWGLMGSVLERYDGWTKGNREKRWSAPMPVDDEQLAPKAMDIAGEYAFVVAVKPTKGIPAMISVFRVEDGAFVGNIWPGKEVGGACGWVDICHAIRAHKRADGEYLILLEDDARGKNILYRWTPGN